MQFVLDFAPVSLKALKAMDSDKIKSLITRIAAELGTKKSDQSYYQGVAMIQYYFKRQLLSVLDSVKRLLRCTEKVC